MYGREDKESGLPEHRIRHKGKKYRAVGTLFLSWYFFKGGLAVKKGSNREAGM